VFPWSPGALQFSCGSASAPPGISFPSTRFAYDAFPPFQSLFSFPRPETEQRPLDFLSCSPPIFVVGRFLRLELPIVVRTPFSFSFLLSGIGVTSPPVRSRIAGFAQAFRRFSSLYVGRSVPPVTVFFSDKPPLFPPPKNRPLIHSCMDIYEWALSPQSATDAYSHCIPVSLSPITKLTDFPQCDLCPISRKPPSSAAMQVLKHQEIHGCPRPTFAPPLPLHLEEFFVKMAR